MAFVASLKSQSLTSPQLQECSSVKCFCVLFCFDRSMSCQHRKWELSLPHVYSQRPLRGSPEPFLPCVPWWQICLMIYQCCGKVWWCLGGVMFLYGLPQWCWRHCFCSCWAQIFETTWMFYAGVAWPAASLRMFLSLGLLIYCDDVFIKGARH